MIDELANLLTNANAVVTFDHERDVTRPCFFCGTTSTERALAVVGRWAAAAGVRGRRGSRIWRPLCEACAARRALDVTPGAPGERIGR